MERGTYSFFFTSAEGQMAGREPRGLTEAGTGSTTEKQTVQTVSLSESL